MVEKKINQNNKTPHSYFFDRGYLVSRIWIALVYISITFSILKDTFGMITHSMDMTISIILIILLFSLNKYFIKLKSDGELLKRSLLLDDSFGTKFCLEESKDYYDNGEMKIGIEKFLANVHESALYTESIVGIMFKRQLLLIFIWLLIIIYFAVIGFKNIPFSFDFFDLFLSYIFIDKAFDMHSLKTVSKKTVEDSLLYWDGRNNDNQLDNKSIAKIIKISISYESSLNSVRFILSSKVKDKLNEKLEKKWKDVCERYIIL